MHRMKILVASLLVVFIVIVVLQNTEAVETRILFMEVSMPRAVLLMVTFLSGVAAGLLGATWVGRQKKSPDSPKK